MAETADPIELLARASAALARDMKDAWPQMTERLREQHRVRARQRVAFISGLGFEITAKPKGHTR